MIDNLSVIAYDTPMNQNIPIGWQNLSPERQRVRGRDTVFYAIRQIHADAEEIQIGDDYAYVVGAEHFLVGFAWPADRSDDSSWCFAVMSATMFTDGIRCSIVSGDRNRIIPTPAIRVVDPPDQSAIITEPPVVESRSNFTLSRDEKIAIKIADLDEALSTRTQNCLGNAGIVTIGNLIEKTNEQILRIPNLGQRTLAEIKQLLVGMELELGTLTSARHLAKFPILKKRFIRRGGKIMVWVETKDRARELGPYNTRKEAQIAVKQWIAL